MPFAGREDEQSRGRASRPAAITGGLRLGRSLALPLQQRLQVLSENLRDLLRRETRFFEERDLRIEHIASPAAGEERGVGAEQDAVRAEDADHVTQDVRGRG